MQIAHADALWLRSNPIQAGDQHLYRGFESSLSAIDPKCLSNHPRQSPTIHSFFSYFPVFSSPTATIEVVGNTGTMSSEKAALCSSRIRLIQDFRFSLL